MANYDSAFKRVLKNEGGYANHPNDAGGETWQGIARNRWSKWSGWLILDSYKVSSSFPDSLEMKSKLDSHVLEFYRENFWNAVRGDEIANQELAEKVFDTAVNVGIKPAVKFLQKALGVPEKDIDGIIGPKTMELISKIK